MIKLKHSSGVVKDCPTGFSWTTFFFGCFVPLFRGDIKWAAILFFAALLAGVFTMGIGTIIVGIGFSFCYNKIYIKDLLQKGYSAYSQADQNWLVEHGIVDGTVSEVRNEVKSIEKNVEKKELVKTKKQKKSKSSGNANLAGAIAGAVAGAVVSGLNGKANAENSNAYTMVENNDMHEQQDGNFSDNMIVNPEENHNDIEAESVAVNQENTDLNQDESQTVELEENTDNEVNEEEETEDEEYDDEDDEESEDEEYDDNDDDDDDDYDED